MLNEKGSVILDFSTSPFKGVYTHSVKDGKNLYKIFYKSVYNKKNHISKDTETLEIFSDNELIKRNRTSYVHRLWTKNELDTIFKKTGFSSVRFYKEPDKMTLMIAQK